MGDQLPAVNLGDRIATRVATGGDASVCVVLNTNQLKCWGQNNFGQLGLGDLVDRLVPDNPLVDLGPDTQDLQ